MGQNEIPNTSRENLNNGLNPNKIDSRFDGVINKEDLSGRILRRIRYPNPNSINGNGKEDVFSGLNITRLKPYTIDQSTKEHLFSLKTGVVPLQSSEYNKILREVKQIIQRSSLGLQDLNMHILSSVVNTQSVIMINLNKAGRVGGSNEIKLILYKKSNRYSVTKNGKTIGGGRF